MPRLEFTTATQREALARSKGVCECHRVPQLATYGIGCDVPLGPGNTFFEHIVPCELGGDNDIDNCAALSRTCWKAKTANYDLRVIAKAKRNFDKDNGIRDPWKKRLPGGRHSAFKLKMNGQVVDRRTGAPR
jgi:hypothetical protein